jgi:tetratricopeptide (TPR) repeat protein
MAGDVEAATEAYKASLELKPGQVKPYVQLCAFLGQQGELEEAAEYCEQAISLSPDNYQAHRNLAIIYKDMERFEEALEQASIARELASEEEKPSWDSFIEQLEAVM